MILREWVEKNSGLWWWRAATSSSLLAALPRPVTVVPSGGPLLGRATPLENCRAYAGLFGVARTTGEIVTCLRTMEVPDHGVDRRADALTELHRMFTWLAMARLAGTSAVVLIDPMEGASQAHRDHLRRILQEAVPFHRHILVVTPHQEPAVSLGAQVVPLGMVIGA